MLLAEIDELDPKKIRITGSSPLQKELFNRIPGTKWNHKINLSGAWQLPLGWTSCLALRATFRTDLELGLKLTEWAFNEVNTRITPCMNLRHALDAPGPDSLFSYQRAGVEFMSIARRALLADEMGTGKTRQSLMTLQRLYIEGTNPFPALVVAPNSTKISWKREAETVWPGLTVAVVSGSAAQRRKQLETPAHIYVMNWESVRGHTRLAPYGSVSLARCEECGGADPKVTTGRCETHLRELNAIDFKSVIADEIHRMKDPKSKQARAVKAATGSAEIRLALTGTPIASAPDDLWSILNWLSPDEWPSRTKFIDRFLDISYNAFGAATVIGVKANMRDEFFAAVDPRMRRMSKDVVLPFLPPKIYERRDVEMAPKQKKAYLQMRDQMLAELDDGSILITTSPLVRMTRLLQFASAYAELEETWNEKKQENEVHVKIADPSCKVDAFLDDLEDFGDESVVVFAVSRQLIELLSDKLTKRKIDHGLITGAQDGDERQHHMDRFQDGKIKLMLCTVAAGGTGITLTRGSAAVFLQRSWSMIDNLQAEARVHRIGSEQHDTIRIIDYVTTNTVEEAVHQAVEEKSNRLEEILRDRELMRKVIEHKEDK